MHNKTYCKFPFNGFQVNARGNRLCCNSSKFLQDKPTEFWNNQYLKEVREKMHGGKELTECNNCYKTEKANALSLRQHYNSVFKEYNTEELPTVADLDFSNLCNLKCIMCNADRSSQWAKDLNKNKETNGVLSISKDKIDDLYSISKNLKHLTIQGGEPSLIPEYLYYFDLLKKDGIISNITLDCITNLTNINNRFYEILNNFKQVNIDVSIDSYDLSNDYIRYPSKFNKIEENLIKISESKHQINLQISLQTLSMYNFYDFLVWIDKIMKIFKDNNKKLGVNLSRVHFPTIFNPDLAPIKLKNKFIEDLKRFTNEHKLTFDLKFNLEIQSLIKNLCNSEKNEQDNLLIFIKDLDQKRNIKVTDYIPTFYDYF
jgi:pyruvate-formate lyase-activating enzyme